MLVNKFSLPAILIAVTAIGIAFQVPLKSCNEKSSSVGSGVVGLEIILDLPLMSMDTVAQHLDTLQCYQKDSIIVFKMPVQLFVSKLFTSPDREVTDDSLIRIGTKYQYYAYCVKNEYGMRYDSIGAKGVVFPVDSFLSTQTVTSFDRMYERKVNNDSLVGKSGTKGGRSYVEKYIPKVKIDATYSDSTIMTYSTSLNKYYFSLSPLLKETKGLNLQSFKLVYNGSPQSDIRSYSIPRYLLFEVNELPRIRYEDIEVICAKFMQHTELLSDL